MKQNQHRSPNVPPKSLETRLRNLPGFSVPAALKTKLLGSIPDNAPSSHTVAPGIFVRKAWAGAAAILLACTLAILINYSSSLLPNGLITEVNIASAGPNTVDQNNTQIIDINRAGLADR